MHRPERSDAAGYESGRFRSGGLALLLAAALFGSACSGPPRVDWTRSVTIGCDAASLFGFQLQVDRTWRTDHPSETRALERALRADLRRLAQEIPPPALQAIREIEISIETQAGVALGTPAIDFRPSTEFPPGRIEVTDPFAYLEQRHRRPMILLHEFAVGYHDEILNGEDGALRAAFEQARLDGRYERVNEAGANGIPSPVPAMSGVTEYFAELSEAYFGLNDQFPFNRSSLARFDPAGHAAVMKLWSLSDEQITTRIN